MGDALTDASPAKSVIPTPPHTNYFLYDSIWYCKWKGLLSARKLKNDLEFKNSKYIVVVDTVSRRLDGRVLVGSTSTLFSTLLLKAITDSDLPWLINILFRTYSIRVNLNTCFLRNNLRSTSASKFNSTPSASTFNADRAPKTASLSHWTSPRTRSFIRRLCSGR